MTTFLDLDCICRFDEPREHQFTAAMSSPLRAVRSAVKLIWLILLVQVGSAQSAESPPPPAQLTAKEDHRRLLDLLGIASLRPGASGQNPNLDESKANPFPNL